MTLSLHDTNCFVARFCSFDHIREGLSPAEDLHTFISFAAPRKILCSTKHVNDSEHHPQPTAVFSNLLAYTEDRSVVLQVCSS